MAKKPSQDPPATAAPKATGEAGAYVVLARKYRPDKFADLIGQEAMVQTLRNAFSSNRIAQGYMLTGVRGVGKTTTARILARGLNFAKPDLPDVPTVEMDGYGIHCAEIIASRHPDVIEMDAASNTGIENVREIIESARYKPLSARYKVFIIDEVHMLSKAAFNALLKTLEEPPAHVKFIFATTEIRKVPVTVLSRCQRFDLRRVDVPELSRHLGSIATQEGASAEPDALAMIARAAEGSVRDGLSILDQAIAMGAGQVQSASVRAMLGRSDRGRLFDLIELTLSGATAEMLAAFEHLVRDGADPGQLIADLAEAVHTATRAKVAGPQSAGADLSADEARRARSLADKLSLPVLSRAWQTLIKGYDEANRAPNVRAASEMVLIRLACLADLPSPDDIIRLLSKDGLSRAVPAPGGAAQRPRVDATPQAREAAPTPTPDTGPPPWLDEAPPAERDDDDGLEPDTASSQPVALPQPRTFPEVVRLVGQKRDAKLKMNLEDNVSLVRFEPGRIEINPLPSAPKELANELSDRLSRWTGKRWVVALSREPGERPLGEINRERAAAEMAEIKAHPAIKAVLATFPDAEIKDIRPIDPLDRDDETGTG